MGHVVAINGYPCCTKTSSVTLFFIAFLKCSKHNYQLDQVLENFKYSFYFDGITLKIRRTICTIHSWGLDNFAWFTVWTLKT